MKRLQEDRIAHVLLKYLVITLGAVIYAVGFQFFLYPIMQV